jgi:hypothetical protein
MWREDIRPREESSPDINHERQKDKQKSVAGAYEEQKGELILSSTKLQNFDHRGAGRWLGNRRKICKKLH